MVVQDYCVDEALFSRVANIAEQEVGELIVVQCSKSMMSITLILFIA